MSEAASNDYASQAGRDGAVEAAAEATGPRGSASVSPSSSAASTGSGLTDYDKGYLDGLLQGTASLDNAKWTETYEKKAKAYLTERGFKGWKVNAKRI